MINNRDYTDRTVYMGIDVHKKTYACVSICEGEIIKRDTIPADVEGLFSYMTKFFPGAKMRSAYEAGFAGFHLHRYLSKNGVSNSVVHPASIEVSSRDRVKTDKRDALKIATQLSVGRLRGIYIPSAEQEAMSNVTRLRTNIVRNRTRSGTRFKSLLFTQGLVSGNDNSVICASWINQKLTEIETGHYPEDLY